jgi:hypothetical protein
VQMKWVLRSSHSIPEVSDDFMVGRFRLRLGGGTLTVEAEGESDEELFLAAHELIARYAAVLRKHIPELINLVTCEEFASMPLNRLWPMKRAPARNF